MQKTSPAHPACRTFLKAGESLDSSLYMAYLAEDAVLVSPGHTEPISKAAHRGQIDFANGMLTSKTFDIECGKQDYGR